MKSFFFAAKKYLIATLFMVVFVFTFINNMPSTMLGNLIKHYSNQRLQLYNPTGTFWNGSGLLAIPNPKSQQLTPLLLVNWVITPGFKKFIDIRFTVGKTPIAELYLNKQGLSLDDLDVSLSITQLSQLFDIVSSLGLSGNIEILSSHLAVSNKISGLLDVKLDSVSSGLSPVNPLGSYLVKIESDSGKIDVRSNPSSILSLDGTGSVQGLALKCRIAADKKSKMLEFVSVMGVPQADGSYLMRIF